MIADKLMGLLIERLNERFETHHVPMDSAYPTSGRDFIRISPNDLSITVEDMIIHIDASFTVTCSTRIRTDARQTEFNSHLRLIDFAEKVFFWILTYSSIRGAMHELFSQSSVTNNIVSKYIDFRVVPVYADFYSSKEVHERQPAGIKIDQIFTLPRLTIPLQCGEINPVYYGDAENEDT